MNELDAAWSELLADATQKAKASGRQDVADYLALKATNDAIRTTAVEWLFAAMIEIAHEENHRNLTIDREEPHSFTYHGSNMSGSLLRLRQGVRCLTIEAGWPRTPTDGFMRGGALAAAKIIHRGMSNKNVELVLIRGEDLPTWKDREAVFDSHQVREHFEVFLGRR